MKSLSDQDHYEILETRRDATPDQIERSFRMALLTYADDSLAGYSVFSEGDAAAFRERIEIAYRVLADPESRRAYNATLGGSADPLDESLDALIASEAHPGAPLPAIEPASATRAPIGDFEQLDDGQGAFDGARLRRYRLRCGMELQEIAGVTKINNGYLEAIEEERFGDLPPKVYVRGFVTAFASMLGLDSKTVVTSYMKRYDEGQQSRPKSRFFQDR